MSNNRQMHGSNKETDDDQLDDDSPNPLYKATSQSEHSSLNRHGGKKKTLAELSGSSQPSAPAAPATDRDKHRTEKQRGVQQYQSHTLPLSRTYNETPMTLDRPDSQTWDRHAMGRTVIGSPGRTTTPSIMTGSGHHEDTVPSKSPSSEDKKSEPVTKPMQARSIRLSLGASSDLAKEARKIPTINCHEKIVLCLDVSTEMESLQFRMKIRDKVSFVTLIKKALGIFFRSKHMINPLHEYALMVLSNTAFWMSDFCSDPMKILTFVDDLSNPVICDTCELSSILDELQKHVVIPRVSDGCSPPYIVRVILIYGRSMCIPQLNRKPHHYEMESSNCFCVDVLYVHDPPTCENNCEKIFEVLCDLDEFGTSYILEASKNPTKVFDCMAQLLAHPLQRCLQQDVSHCLD